jgi:hypothetical protein
VEASVILAMKTHDTTDKTAGVASTSEAKQPASYQSGPISFSRPLGRSSSRRTQSGVCMGTRLLVLEWSYLAISIRVVAPAL